MVINCPECGGKVSDKASKCPHCGVRIRKRSYAWLIYLSVIAVVVGIACGYFYFQEQKKNMGQHKFEMVMQSNNIDEMQEFLDLNPNTPESQRKALEKKIAQLSIVANDWNDAVERGSRSALVTFVHKYPNDVHAHEAKVMIDSLDWITAKRQDTEESYTTYMEHHSNGNYYYDAHNALRRLRDEREEAERRMQAMSDTIDAYFENEEY